MPGCRVGISASPLIPGITDREGELESLADAARDAGAQWISSGVLFLMPSSAKQFLPFPARKISAAYAPIRIVVHAERLRSGTVPTKISARLGAIKATLGLTFRPWEQFQRPVAPSPQLSLAL